MLTLLCGCFENLEINKHFNQSFIDVRAKLQTKIRKFFVLMFVYKISRTIVSQVEPLTQQRSLEKTNLNANFTKFTKLATIHPKKKKTKLFMWSLIRRLRFVIATKKIEKDDRQSGNGSNERERERNKTIVRRQIQQQRKKNRLNEVEWGRSRTVLTRLTVIL